MRSFIFDLRYAARVVRQNPGFATVAIATRALGMGGTTAIFSVLDPVLIRPLPYAEPDRLVSVSMWFPSVKLETLHSADFAQFERESHAFASMAAYPNGLSMTNLMAAGAPFRAAVVKGTPSFFPTLGLAPLMGRAFLPRESRPVAANVAILTHGLWMRGFGADPGVLGKNIILDEQAYVIVGVMPAGFRFPEEEKVDVLTPLPLDDARLRHGPEMRTWRGIGRLKAGVSVAQATAELETIFARIREQYKFFYRNDVQLRVVPLQWHQAREVRTSLLVLAAAVGFVLLIACVNVALILMARASGRAGEIAVRLALGARRMRLARQLLTESALMGLLGGALGVLVAFAGMKSAARLLPADIPHIDQVAVNLRALGFTALVAIAAGLLFGLAPVAAAWRTDLSATLKLGGGASRGRARRSLWSGLLVAEIAFSMVLLAGAALLVESLWRLGNIPLGFYPERVVAASIPLAGSPEASGPREKQFLTDAIERCARLPSVTAAAFADSLPPGDNGGLQTFSREDRPLPEPGHRGDNMLLRGVTADYFRAMGIPLLRGRTFAARDAEGIVIVNQALARR